MDLSKEHQNIKEKTLLKIILIIKITNKIYNLT